MKLGRRIAPILALALMTGAAAAAGAVVNMDLATQRRVGVVSQPIAASRHVPEVRGFAKVLDPGPLASLDSDIAQAAAAAQASSAEFQRSKALNAADQTVSRKAVEAAQAQSAADQAKLSLLRRRLGLEWGGGVAALSDSRRSALIREVASGRAALVRIDTPSGRGLPGLKSLSIDVGSSGQTRAVVLGPARTADTQLLSPGLVAVASGPGVSGLSVGLTTPVSFPAGAGEAGVVLPRSALIRTAGQTWAYVRRSPTSFERRSVAGSPQGGGLFTVQGVAPGDQVVVSGAGALFTAEGHGGGDAD